MTDFTVRFFICNIFMSVVITGFLAFKYLLRGKLTSRSQYQLWFPLMGLLTVPFLPLRLLPDRMLAMARKAFRAASASYAGTGAGADVSVRTSQTGGWMNDFGMSVSQKTPSVISQFLCILWICGMAAVLFWLLRSGLRLYRITQSALPLQNREIRSLYRQCLDDMHIGRDIPVRSTAFLKSPVITGPFRPCIYLPIHLISDYDARSMRYMLLHELSHYRHRDMLAGCWMNLLNILYWFSPFVWLARREMRSDQEIACDASVLDMLKDADYAGYGNTLLNLAGKVSCPYFPFAAGISGNLAQMKKRILNIAGYRPASFGKQMQSRLVCLFTAVILAGMVPLVSIQASDSIRYHFGETGKTVVYPDLSASFGENRGSFVLYDTKEDIWQIYNKDAASMRTVPASTFKIYSALLALENGVITPEQSFLDWDGRLYQYDAWNRGQTLESAMENSVNWYFQELDARAGLQAIQNYIGKIGYGNRNAADSTETYWLDGSLKISPIEQTQMLQKFNSNAFHFKPEHIEAVKNAIRLDSSENGTLYGKTGTVITNGRSTCGWFVGFVEKEDGVCYFAVNIQQDDRAGGAEAARLAFKVLSGLGVWDFVSK